MYYATHKIIIRIFVSNLCHECKSKISFKVTDKKLLQTKEFFKIMNLLKEKNVHSFI